MFRASSLCRIVYGSKGEIQAFVFLQQLPHYDITSRRFGDKTFDACGSPQNATIASVIQAKKVHLVLQHCCKTS